MAKQRSSNAWRKLVLYFVMMTVFVMLLWLVSFFAEKELFSAAALCGLLAIAAVFAIFWVLS